MVWAVFLLQLANGTQQSLDGFMLQFNKNAHGVAPTSQVHTFSVCLLLVLAAVPSRGKMRVQTSSRHQLSAIPLHHNPLRASSALHQPVI